MSLGDRLGIAGLVVALLGIGITILWPEEKWIGWLCIGVAGLLILLWVFAEFRILLDIIRRYRKPIAATALIIGMCIFGIFAWRKWISNPSVPQIAKQPKGEEPKKVQPNKESKPSPPFAVQIESLMASQHPQKNESPFLVVYRSGDSGIASPGRIALYMRFTNLQKQPAMISKYSVIWGKYKLIKITGPPTEMFYLSDGNMHHACWVNDTDILDKQLVGLNLQPRVPVQGVALFDYPAESRPESLSESYLKVGLTVTITDVEGVSFTTAPIVSQPDTANESVQSRIVRFNRGTRDLSNFKIADFGVLHGFISPPF